jgi:phosphonate transport system substrate-binding protein
VDVAWLATPAYIVAHDNCGAQAWFSVVRGGLATHTAEIIVQADAARKARNLAPINTLGDLGDKAFGFTDPLSTTGYLFPKAMLVENGVRLGSELFLGAIRRWRWQFFKGEGMQGPRLGPPRSDASWVTDRRIVSDYPDVGSSSDSQIVAADQTIR